MTSGTSFQCRALAATSALVLLVAGVSTLYVTQYEVLLSSWNEVPVPIDGGHLNATSTTGNKSALEATQIGQGKVPNNESAGQQELGASLEHHVSPSPQVQGLTFEPRTDAQQRTSIRLVARRPSGGGVSLQPEVLSLGTEVTDTGVTSTEVTNTGVTNTEVTNTPRTSTPIIPSQSPPTETSYVGKDVILGSRLKPGKAVRDFRERWACLTSLNSSSWVIDPTPRLLPWTLAKWNGPCAVYPGYLGAASNGAFLAGQYAADRWPVAESLKYVWRPRSSAMCGGGPAPSFTSLDGNATCQALRRTKGSLFIVGDSISDQFFVSVLNQLTMLSIGQVQRAPTPACTEAALEARTVSPPGAAPPFVAAICRHYFICGTSWATGALQLHFSRSLYLERLHRKYLESEEIFLKAMKIPEIPWAEEAVRWRASVLVLNRGAHFVPNELGFIRQLNYTMRELRRMLPNSLIIFRSTPSGHPNCSQYDRPVSSPLKIDKWPFNWDRFEEQNRIAKDIVESVGGVFFDVAPMTSLRPDWHVRGPRQDCLHHCLPGIVDDWVKLFARMLEELV